jgi:hypothetical protein
MANGLTVTLKDPRNPRTARTPGPSGQCQFTTEAVANAVGRRLDGALPGGKITHAYVPTNGSDLRSNAGPGKLRDLAAEDPPTRTGAKDTRRNYSARAADILDDVAAWAYSDGQTLADALRHRGIIEPGDRCFEVSLANEPMLVVATAFLVRSGPVGVLCFRGTEPMRAVSWLTDVNVQPTQFLSMGRVHGGFIRNLRAVWSDVDAEVGPACQGRDGGSKLEALYLTGHSLGGAMAVLAAATLFKDPQWKAWRNVVRGVYTYGQPMVGDPEFAASCEAAFGFMHFRHVFEHDLVPRMPPTLVGRFEHSGMEYAGSADGGWSPRRRAVSQASSVLSIPIAFAAFLLEQIPLLAGVPLPYSIGDHSPNGYLEAFRAMRD